MSRVNVNDGQELVFEDDNKISSLLQQEIYDRVIKELLQRQVDGFFQDSLKVNFIAATTISVNAGLGFQEDLTVSSVEPTLRPIYQAASTNQSLTPADGVNDRIDIITVKHNLADGNTESRKFKAAIGGAISNQNFVVDKDWSVTFNIIAGTPAGSPVAPAVPAGEIKIAEMLVSAVTGLAGAGAITDSRVLLPIGGVVGVDTTGATRLTAGASIAINTLMSEIDAFLVSGLQDFTDMIDQVTDPAVPAASRLRVYLKGTTLFTREPGGTVTPLGSGAGGGGGGANWVGDTIEALEFGENTKKYGQGAGQTEQLYIKVPQGYLAGRQIKMFLAFYSPSAANEFSMQTVSSLIRKNLDAITSVANQHTNDIGDLTNTVANQYREGSLDITDATGQMNGFSVSPGDVIKVELTRKVPAGTEDTADIRFVPSSTEVKFG